MISKDTQTRIIRAYLGRFSVSVLKADQNKFLEMLGDSQSVFIKGPQMLLNQFICTVLMRKRVFHSYRTTYDTVQMFLGQNEDSPDFMDLTSGVLIIEHAKAYRDWETDRKSVV